MKRKKKRENKCCIIQMSIWNHMDTETRKIPFEQHDPLEFSLENALFFFSSGNGLRIADACSQRELMIFWTLMNRINIQNEMKKKMYIQSNWLSWLTLSHSSPRKKKTFFFSSIFLFCYIGVLHEYLLFSIHTLLLKPKMNKSE